MNKNVSNFIYLDLKSKILHLQLQPGESLNEQELALNYNVSRTPVKNALTHLEHDGLIMIRKNVGSIVTKLSITKITSYLKLREIVETAIISENKKNFSQVLFLELQLEIAKQEQLINQIDVFTSKCASEFLELDNNFHRKLFEFTQNLDLWEVLQKEQVHYMRYRLLCNTDSVDILQNKVDEHKQIVHLLETNDKKLNKYYHNHIFYSNNNQINFFIEQYPQYFE